MGAVVVAGLAALPLWLRAPSSPAGLCDALARRRVVTVYASPDAHVRCEGVREVSLPEALVRGLEHETPGPVIDFLRSHKGSALAIAPAGEPRGVGAKLAALAHVPELPALALAPELAVYAPSRDPSLSDAERDALAYVARALFRGAREPDVASFPPPLRRVERVEVMVTLSKGGDPRLWRSARGTSVARALLTATRVARDRWREREQAMGGPLIAQLASLDVEVALLAEDGTLLSAQNTFVDRAITPAHGVGFDRRTAWHYVLPAEVQRRKGGAAALAGQLSDLGLPAAVLGESDTRLYRFVQTPLGVSRAPSAAR
ncbi:MAG: hypothetical protein ABW252_25710 [Polyangiales bacterium]